MVMLQIVGEVEAKYIGYFEGGFDRGYVTIQAA
jgi:hypothetical protein